MKEKSGRIRVTPGRIRVIVRRLSLGIAVLSLTALLILWDAGVLVIPGLTPPERRQSLPDETLTRPETVPTKLSVDWAAWAEDQIRALYDVSQLTDPVSLIRIDSFQKGVHSVVRQIYGGDQELSVFAGILTARDGDTARYYLPGSVSWEDLSQRTQMDPENTDAYPLLSFQFLTEIETGGEYVLTQRKNSSGQAVFQKKDGSLAVYDTASSSFVPFEPGFLWETVSWETVPGNEGDGSGLKLISENGLFGYSGTVTEGKRVISVSVPCIYSVAFPYREGVAVMADEEGRITLRDSRGDVMMSDKDLLLADSWREDDSFCFFSQNLLRTVFVSRSENGAILSQSEGILTQQGSPFSLPEGFRATAYQEGVFTVAGEDARGYFGADGKWIGTPVYEAAASFREGLAVVTGKDGKMGLMDREGHLILAAAFEEITPFSGGLALVKDNAVGQVVLWKVEGQYPPPGSEDEVPDRSYYERVPLSRGPKNTFDDGNEIVIVLPVLDNPPWVTTSTKKPIYTIPVITNGPDPTVPPSSVSPDPPETSSPGGEGPDASSPSTPDASSENGTISPDSSD